MILKRCTKCGETKVTTEFVRNKNNHDGLSPWCKVCHRESTKRYQRANAEKVKAKTLAWRAANPEKVKAWASRKDNRRLNLKARFRMTPEDYDALLASQGGVCAICGGTQVERGRQNMHLDHDYETGKVRGILCCNCNRGVGMFGDSPERLEAAAAYLRAGPTQYGRPPAEAPAALF